MENKSFHISQVISAIAFPVVGVLFAIAGVLFNMFMNAGNEAGIFGICIIPIALSIIPSILLLVGALTKKEKMPKILAIVYNALTTVLGILASIAIFFVALLVGGLGAAIAAIIRGIFGGGSDPDPQADLVVKKIMAEFTPMSLICLLLGIFSLVALVFAIVHLASKKKVPGIIMGEVMIFSHALLGAGLTTYVLFQSARSDVFNPSYPLMMIAVMFMTYSLVSFGQYYVSINKEKKTKLDFVSNILEVIHPIAIMILIFTPGYLFTNTIEEIYIESIPVIYSMIFILSYIMYVVSKYIKKVFFLNLIALPIVLFAFVIMILTLGFRCLPSYLPYIIISAALAFVGSTSLFVFDLLKKIKVIKPIEVQPELETKETK